MKPWSRYLLVASVAGLAALVLFSCSQPAQKPTSSTPSASSAQPSAPPPAVTSQPGVQQRSLPQTKPPTVQHATITFITGDVQTNSGSSWEPASIGDDLTPSERLKTGSDSFCELQFGNLATARIEANSVVSIARLVLGQARQVNVALSTGAVVSKVQKLVGKDQYNIATPTAVAGVRGTEFRVATSSGGTTELSVKRGVVTVVPPQASIAGKTPQQQAVAQQVEQTLIDKAPRVTAEQQLVVTSKDFAPVVQQLAEVKKQIDAGATTTAIASLVDATATTAQKAVPKPSPISASQQSALAVTNTMQLLPTTPRAPKPAPASGKPAPPPSPTSVPFSVNVLPAQAQVYLNGQLVGTSGFSALYQPGRTLSLSIRLAGYQTKNIPVTVPASGVGLTISLTKAERKQPSPPKPKASSATATLPPAPSSAAATSQPAALAKPAPAPKPTPAPKPQPASKPAQLSVSIAAAPSNAQIIVNGQQVGIGSYQGHFAAGQQIRVDVRASGYTPESRSVTIGQNTGTLSFQLSKIVHYGNVAVTTSPSGASIYVNGQYEGTGSYSARYQQNTTIQVRASLRGYSDATTSVTVAANVTTSRTLTLTAHPIDARISVAGSPLVRTLAVWNNNLISVDKTGTLRSTSENGTSNWEVSTGNSGNANSQPVVADGAVFLSGTRSFVGVDASTGAQLFHINLGQSNAHLFGRSVSIANGELYYPTDNSIVVYGERTGQVLRRIPLPNNSNMSALVSGQHLYIVDQQGAFYDLSTKNGQVNSKVASSAVQPVATAPVKHGSQVFFTGRRGTAVLVDTSNDTIVWQKALSPKASVGVFTDPLFAGNGIYVYGNNTLFGLSPSNGNNLFTPIANVSAPPLLEGTALYYGTTGGKLVKANALTGAVEATLNIGSKITTRPAKIGNDIAVGTESGQIVLVYPRTM